ncbi:MAG: integrase core domain-containing protein [Candidatus Liptonbacteria bacterium]|nr:integrase core domain-containing protein [Candidatus Liptonbacteria bacterium]
MNAHLERFNRTIQEEFIDYHSFLLLNPDEFNRKLIDYLIFYNTERVHYAFQNKLSPVQFMLSLKQRSSLYFLQNKIPLRSQECKSGCGYTII